MAASTAATTAVAAALYKYTYTLGRSLYVPLTSRCNSIPLPSTRGPGFFLPRSVAEALARVRADEVPGSVLGGAENCYDDWGDEERVPLPPYDMPLVNGLYDFNDDLPMHLERRREIMVASAAGGSGEEEMLDDMLQPSIATIVNEVSSRLHDTPNFDQVVIAGEGEPTLRMDALLAVARSVQSFRNDNNQNGENIIASSKPQSGNKRYGNMKQSQQLLLPVRVITNGLCYGIPNLGYSPQNLDRSGAIIPRHRHVILRDMLEAGISRVSVALNTANRHEYDVLMEPSCYTGGGMMEGGDEINGNNNDGLNKEGNDSSSSSSSNNNAAALASSAPLMPGTSHDMVCEFIMEATKLGMDVELTGIDRPEVDRRETERLARLLLSVGPTYKRRKMIRWRKYFD